MMKHIFQKTGMAGLIIGLSACARNELPVPKHDPGDVTTRSVSMESDYRYQVYYNLKDSTEVGRNLKTAWDLGFEASAEGWHVILNGAKSMFALPVTKSSLAQVTIADTAGFDANKIWDVPSGNLDSTAIGDWKAYSDRCYIVDRGYDASGVHLGIEKVQIKSADAQHFTVAYAAINSGTINELTILKDSLYNFMFLSFDEKTTIRVEPPKATWDLVFTQYTHTFYEPSYRSYLVTGCLLNRSNTTALAVDSTKGFEAVTYDYLTGRILSSAINTIGYDWKVFTGSTYITDANKAYIVRDVNGIYYKLHFVGFLNSAGVKGNPKWEYQRL